MKSTFSGLNTLVRGLYAQQLSLDTIGHNISNASTEGYSRQRVNITTTRPEQVAGGMMSFQVGTGVAIESVTRARDFFMDLQMWKESSSLGYGLSAANTFGKIEGIFHDDADVGIQTVLNNFWNAWQTLSTNGSNDSARMAVRERGAELVSAIDHAAEQLKAQVSDVNSAIITKVEQINQITGEILSLNKQISIIEVGGLDNANDLRDRRDLLVDQLSKLSNITVHEDRNKNYVIQMAGLTLVDGNMRTELASVTKPDTVYGFARQQVTVKQSGQEVYFANGEMKALQEANNTNMADIPAHAATGAQAYLDKLALMSRFLLQEFNAVHRAGFGSDNSTGVNFFGDAGVNYVTAPLTDAGDWLNALKINPDLYNANGLQKVAAKTAAVTSVVQSNATGGKGTVGGTYVPPNSNYQSYIVSIDAVAGSHVSSIRYSLDGGVTFSAAVNEAPAGSGTFALPYGLNITIADGTNNVNDTYRFSVPQGNASGDNAVLLSNAIKQPTNQVTSVLQGSSLDDYYESMVAALGVETQNRQRLATNQQTLVDQIENWRQSTSGVNIDEEMSNMIRFQKGYNAAARVVTAIDEMLDKLINGTGVVGR